MVFGTVDTNVYNNMEGRCVLTCLTSSSSPLPRRHKHPRSRSSNIFVISYQWPLLPRLPHPYELVELIIIPSLDVAENMRAVFVMVRVPVMYFGEFLGIYRLDSYQTEESRRRKQREDINWAKSRNLRKVLVWWMGF
jgi:hypothetical protein